jgi:hypothetical protein
MVDFIGPSAVLNPPVEKTFGPEETSETPSDQNQSRDLASTKAGPTKTEPLEVFYEKEKEEIIILEPFDNNTEEQYPEETERNVAKGSDKIFNIDDTVPLIVQLGAICPVEFVDVGVGLLHLVYKERTNMLEILAQFFQKYSGEIVAIVGPNRLGKVAPSDVIILLMEKPIKLLEAVEEQ